MHADYLPSSLDVVRWRGAVARHRQPDQARPPRPWPLALIALAAGVALWSGWVELGKLTGFGVVTPLPGILDDFTINSAIVLPLGVEAYAAYAVRVVLAAAWLSERTRQFARWSFVASLLIGGVAQVASHLMTANGITQAPWPVTVLVASVPVLVAGLATGLAQLVAQDSSHHQQHQATPEPSPLLVTIPPAVLHEALAGPPVLADPPPAVVEPTPALADPPPVRPVLADRLAIVASITPALVQPLHQDTGINLPLEVQERALELIKRSERNGRRIGRPALARELEISDHQARKLLDQLTSHPAHPDTDRQEAASA